MSGIEMKAHKGRLVHVRETGRVDQGDQATPVRSLPSRAKDSDYPDEVWFTPGDNSSELYVRKALLPAAGMGEVDIPQHIREQVLSMGRVEWGATKDQVSADHISDFAETLRITREHFDYEDVPVRMHGLYLEGTGTVLCHTGTSPNSAGNAQALTGAWNWLFDQCQALTPDPARDAPSRDRPPG